ncbi:16863_t:CDS:1 [Funneliformis geosporum]|uniref:16226_t:CDS:1 n=1 Tax=Funneliformis geosporum TaxID=1117311 RepID=A0A9W4SHZ4_9GLOM|nr:16226_t:CDS:1 [Funneliformis geosporum]CAI2169688.1 16863_t:CDS:1 [Funneliformis geosporum]
MPPKPKNKKVDVPESHEEVVSKDDHPTSVPTEEGKQTPQKSKKSRRRKEEEEYRPSDSEGTDSSDSNSSRQGRKTSKKPVGKQGSRQHSPHQSSDTDDSGSSESSSRSPSPGGSKDDDEKKGTRSKSRKRRRTHRQKTLIVHKNKSIIPKIIVRHPTKKSAKGKKKEDLDKEKLTPPTPVKKTRKKGKEKVKTTDDDNHSNELDELLASFPPPSSSRPSVFNKNIAMIGALNIQAFGSKKASNHILMRIITDILRSYDIILCQEIRASDEIIQQLADEVSTPATPYTYVASHPIGRNSYQERYVFLYRKNEWKVLEAYVVDDEKLGDKFIREPYVARFQHLKKSDVRITLVGCHTQPENAYEEIKSLISEVYVDVKKKLVRDIVQEKRQLERRPEKKEKRFAGLRSFFLNYCCCCFGSYSPISTRDFTEEASQMGLSEDGTAKEPIIMMGDLNASGSYLNKTQRTEIDNILKGFNLMWGIQHNRDTTVSDGSDAAYDRFIFEIANERKWIGQTGIWRFDEGWKKGKADTALIKKAAKRVTDHYPIEFELKL